eukprot:11211519-Lingulodinium_polyedra.AAC.1
MQKYCANAWQLQNEGHRLTVRQALAERHAFPEELGQMATQKNDTVSPNHDLDAHIGGQIIS